MAHRCTAMAEPMDLLPWPSALPSPHVSPTAFGEPATGMAAALIGFLSFGSIPRSPGCCRGWRH